MFTMTIDWLKSNYGSEPNQVGQTKDWLKKYGINVPEDKIDEWAQYKHLSEYQVNTQDIVPRALAMVGSQFHSKWSAHREINLMRVPIAAAYEEALHIVRPRIIVELGVGGDSAISTSIFIAYLSQYPSPLLLSCDYHPLGKTWYRYKSCIFWGFYMMDSLEFLHKVKDKFQVRPGLIFVDSIHSFEHTLSEIVLSAALTDNILLDDSTFEGNDFDEVKGGVKGAIEVWMEGNKNWKRTELNNNAICLLRKEN
uniref:Methyltransferase n=1 Tax=viral metagenome TaxID=1070528 RepID=A0A6M3J6H9_9ZZZZ